MKRFLCTFLLLVTMFACITPALSQGFSISMGSSSQAEDGVSVNPNLSVGIVIQLSGTWSGEVTFKRTTNGIDYTPVMALNLETNEYATTTTTNGQYCIYAAGAVGVIADLTTYTSGTLVRRGCLTNQIAKYSSSYGGGDGSGDVVGAASSTDNAIARFNGTNGKIIQNSVVTVADTTGNIAGVGTLNTHTIPGGTSTFALYTDKLSVFNNTTSDELAGVLTNESGSAGGFVRQTAPAITGGSHVALTDFGIRSSGSGAFDLKIINTENLSANRNLTFVLGDAARSLTIGASASVAGSNTGDQTSVTGNAGSATILQTARTIGGVSFDGSASITVASAIGGFTVSGGDLIAVDDAYNATTWNGSAAVPTKNAIRDKIESLGGASGDVVGPSSSTDNAITRFDSTTGKLLQNSGATVNDNGRVITAGGTNGGVYFGSTSGISDSNSDGRLDFFAGGSSQADVVDTGGGYQFRVNANNGFSTGKFVAAGDSPRFSHSNFNNCSALTTISNVITCTASDRRIKENFSIFSQDNALASIRLLSPQFYSFKKDTQYYDNGRRRLGLIAQNVQEAGLANAVLPIGNGLLQVDYQAIAAASIAAIKELDAKIARLERALLQARILTKKQR